jgi:hypothetical protein
MHQFNNDDVTEIEHLFEKGELGSLEFSDHLVMCLVLEFREEEQLVCFLQVDTDASGQIENWFCMLRMGKVESLNMQ